jgi:hypothetical protein
MSNLKLRRLAGIDTPNFYEYVKAGNVTAASAVELTEMQWALIDVTDKGTFNNENAYLIYESGTLKVVPVKVISNAPKLDGVTPHADSVKNTESDGGDSEKTGDDMIKAVKSGKKKDDTDKVVKEDAESMAKKLIATIKAGRRLDDTKQTDTDATAAAAKDVDTLGDEKIADGDEGDTKFKPLKKETEVDSRTELKGKKPVGEAVVESAEEVAARIIAAVKAGNPPQDAMNPSETPEKKSLTFDYNAEISPTTDVDAARANNDSAEQPVVDAKTGEDTIEKSMEIPSEVASQIDQRISELKAAQAEFDNKGYNDDSVKQNAIDFLEKVKEHLGKGDIEGFQQAQILFQTLMSPITDLLPAGLVLFLGTGANKKASMGEVAETK